MAEQVPPRSGLQVPLWVALAGMVVALILGLIIMGNILRPLVTLIFPSSAEIPLPSDAVLLESNENPRTSDGEWLYGSNLDGCTLVGFYVEAGGSCNLVPFSCIGNPNEKGHYPRSNAGSVATCQGKNDDILNSYSWEVLIGTGYGGDHYTRFRVYLYEER